ncbi:-glutamine gamma-glutamyltransferase 6-like [Pelobates cultripes]|uniref:protein-glutamine gamma-glutamyltransferase n=2 Tax=Pelobates cultripes TaxID=61616 RepID=A0AAD1WFG5_PELCU|nr:-glutamine gamma-glutamyltransferase 6-like [Pelobates cultripes]
MAALKLKTFSMEETLNMVEHRTDYYHTSDLVVRRGQPFIVNITFNRPLQKGDKVEFIAATGPDPQESDHTKVVFSLSDSSEVSWTAVPDSSSSQDTSVTITSPSDAVIGRYKLNVHISSKKKRTYYKLNNVVLLFNPWAPDDDVFMEDENERQEYVLNDSGTIYFGLEDYIMEEPWNFGQFEEGILDICLKILDNTVHHQQDPVLDYSKRNDPIYVSRVLTAIVNSLDEDGLLEGRWTGTYRDGTDPQEWIGSVEILQKWQKSGYKTVKYGQCWVFAGVLCTVFRALGIPTRVITNFCSAHDKEKNLSIDTIYSSTGRNKSKDTMWNYHCWNECWFLRPDLGLDYGGWQVLDSTPQEISDALYCCGPVSVHAVKEGDLDLDYDTLFVYSEVNADRYTWVYYDKDVKEKVYTDTNFVGKNMSTKSVGTFEREIITENYKYPEGSEEERVIYQKATKKLAEMGKLKKEHLGERTGKKRSKKKKNVDTSADSNNEEPVTLVITGKFKLQAEPKFGEDVNLMLILRNSSKNSETVKIKLSSSSIEYTGRPRSEIFKDSTSCTIAPMEEKEIPVKITASMYEEELTKDYLIEAVALCELKTKKKLLVRKVIAMGKPPIEIKVLSYAVVDEPCELQINFTNPLSVPLNDGILLVGGSGLVKKLIKKKVPKMEPNGQGSILLEITPYRSGMRQLVVDLISKQFPPIKGSHNFHVENLNTEETIDLTDN